MMPFISCKQTARPRWPPADAALAPRRIPPRPALRRPPLPGRQPPLPSSGPRRGAWRQAPEQRPWPAPGKSPGGTQRSRTAGGGGDWDGYAQLPAVPAGWRGGRRLLHVTQSLSLAACTLEAAGLRPAGRLPRLRSSSTGRAGETLRAGSPLQGAGLGPATAGWQQVPVPGTHLEGDPRHPAPLPRGRAPALGPRGGGGEGGGGEPLAPVSAQAPAAAKFPGLQSRWLSSPQEEPPARASLSPEKTHTIFFFFNFNQFLFFFFSYWKEMILFKGSLGCFVQSLGAEPAFAGQLQRQGTGKHGGENRSSSLGTDAALVFPASGATGCCNQEEPGPRHSLIIRHMERKRLLSPASTLTWMLRSHCRDSTSCTLGFEFCSFFFNKKAASPAYINYGILCHASVIASVINTRLFS